MSGIVSINRNLVHISIEKALLNLGAPELEKVQVRLKNDYNCTIKDCYDHPEYLKRILYDLFGFCYKDIIDSIYDVLKGGNIEGRTKKFLKVLYAE